ncbi:MAG: 4Fe-4S double cluster binding domain-containing protein [Chloroflexota bacterium]
MSVLEELKRFLLSKGADMVGVADLRGLAPDVRYNLPFGISIAVALNPRIVSEILDGPTKEYFAEYTRVNALLAELGDNIARRLNDQGNKAKWLAPTIVLHDPVTHSGVSYDPTTMSTQLPHKTAATLSGLGWIGKNAMLITEPFGSAVRLTTVLTDADLPVGNPINSSRCGNCRKCVNACPGHAPSGKSWFNGAIRGSFFDAFACRQTAFRLTSENVGIPETLCGICIAACPWTQKYIKSAR